MAIFQFEYDRLSSDEDLTSTLRQLLQSARQATHTAYAPYSHFHVGAAVLLANGNVIVGVNIENASYPVGICAERSALASAISQFPNEHITALAISVSTPQGNNDAPAFPCGMCRQFISECEDRNNEPITLVLSGQTGEVLVVKTAKDLLPFSFSGKDLNP